MNAAKLIVAIAGGLALLTGAVLLAGGAALLVVHASQRDDDGFLNSPLFRLQSDGYALLSDDVDIASRPGDWFPSGLASVRFEVEAGDRGPTFIGIGASDRVDDYLSGVARDQVTRLGPSRSDVEYRSFSGAGPAALPGSQTFWVAAAQGPGEQTVTWEVESGEWSVVVMNADASRVGDIDVRAGVKTGVLLPIGIGLTVGGFVLAIAGFVLVTVALRSGPGSSAAQPVTRGPAPARPAPGAGNPYPVIVEGQLDPALGSLFWLVKWFLAIPHYLALLVLWTCFAVLTVVAFVAIVFTGRYPKEIFDFNVGVLRWTWRVGFYTFSPNGASVMGTDRYPPFTLADADYPARLYVEYPEKLSRRLVLVKWWLLAIPHYLILGVLTAGVEFSGGLIGILVLIAVLFLAFTRQYRQDLFDLIVGFDRWVYRVVAYAALMTDEYPPFRLDLGGTDPHGAEAAPRQALAA